MYFEHKQKGFAPILILVGFLMLIGAVVGVYFLSRQASQGSYQQNPVITSDSYPQASASASVVPSPTPTSTDETASWKIYTSSCGFVIKYPPEWTAQKYFIMDGEGACVYITAPDYTSGLDSRTGFSVDIGRMVRGSSIGEIPINTIDDYIKADEAVWQFTQPVANKIQKTYGKVRGTQFDFAAAEDITTFIFEKGNYFYIIDWPTARQYGGQYRTSIDQILSTLIFTD